MKNIILTGDRPTGKLHIGHYAGSLKNRIAMQNEGNYESMYIMIADTQALTDNFNNVAKVSDNILEVALDYLACGIDPAKTTIYIQSKIPALFELTTYFMNLVTVSRLQRNPTVKSEIKMRKFEMNIPTGFFVYPISQAADILIVNANIVPVGEDQLPMIEQTREIARSFNNLYGETFVESEAILPSNKTCLRLPGTDGKAKMSKSLGNCIYLADSADEIKSKVMKMYTDPNHINISDPGNVEDNAVFTYLRAFCKDEQFERYLKDYANLAELEEHYSRGGVGDVKVKKFLNKVLQEELEPIRNKREELSKNPDYVMQILRDGCDKANIEAEKTISKVRKAMGIDYFA